jgi:hypothetical protein
MEIRSRAERRFGELMRDQKNGVGLNLGSSRVDSPEVSHPTLALRGNIPVGGSDSDPPTVDRPTLAAAKCTDLVGRPNGASFAIALKRVRAAGRSKAGLMVNGRQQSTRGGWQTWCKRKPQAVTLAVAWMYAAMLGYWAIASGDDAATGLRLSVTNACERFGCRRAIPRCNAGIFRMGPYEFESWRGGFGPRTVPIHGPRNRLRTPGLEVR